VTAISFVGRDLRPSNQPKKSSTTSKALPSLTCTLDALMAFIFISSLSPGCFFWSATGLSNMNCLAFLSTSGTASCEIFKEKGSKALVSMRAMLLTMVLGKMADRVESA